MTENLNTFPKASTEEIQIYFHIFFQTNCLSVTEEELVLCVNGFSLGHCSCRFSIWLCFWTGPLSRVLGSVLWLTVDRTANVTHHRTTAQSSYHPQSDSLWRRSSVPSPPTDHGPFWPSCHIPHLDLSSPALILVRTQCIVNENFIFDQIPCPDLNQWHIRTIRHWTEHTTQWLW